MAVSGPVGCGNISFVDMLLLQTPSLEDTLILHQTIEYLEIVTFSPVKQMKTLLFFEQGLPLITNILESQL